jgi:hypothetical protein
MPAYPTYRRYLDDALQLDIKTLKRLGFLELNRELGGQLIWSNDYGVLGKIGIEVTMIDIHNPFIKLSYKYNDEKIEYCVDLVSVQSNLNKGQFWLFECPKTNVRCRKLHLINGFFYHRTAFKGHVYRSQARSHKMYFLDKLYGAYFDLDKHYMELYSKHFKKTYAGKSTKRYVRLMNKIQQGERVNYKTIEELMIA